MLEAFVNAFKIPELRKRILFTLGALVVYRIGCYIPTPGIDGKALAEFFERIKQTQGGTLFGIMNMFSGGAMERLTIFALGIMPNISASIILQLLTAVFPYFEKLAKEELGRKKLVEYTRYGTVLLGIIQSLFISLWLENPQHFQGMQIVAHPGWSFRLLTIITLTTGTTFIMWLGEQISDRGIGNGMSLIITIGITSRIPTAVYQLFLLLSPFSPTKRQLQPIVVLIMAVLLIAVTVAVIIITQAQRKIPVQYAKRIIGHRMYGGQSTYLPLRINQAGVIPIIFAQSIILFPATLASFIPNPKFQALATQLLRGHWLYTILYTILIIFFSYFYTAVTFNPIEISENMQRFGGFIPGVRPGKSTSDYLDYVMTRVTLAGALSLAAIAIFPDLIGAWLKVPYLIASFFGGTALLIIVGVILDTVRQVESHLLMRHYEGFMKKGKVKGRR